ncbi:MAG: alkaline phosphatase D family protein [Myxococcota bacterium]|nr:alkaline phosphatase D family protein [Myxococcota bacterium]
MSVWTSAASLSMVVMEADGDRGWLEVLRREGLSPVDGVLQAPLSGLRSDEAYCVAFRDEDTGHWSRVARFRTALAGDGWRVVTFGATSCLGGNEPWRTLTQAAGAQLDFFAFLVDTVYADGSVELDDYRLSWSAARTTPGFVDVTASTAMVATWDDHEVGNNWTADGLAPGQFDAALRAFREVMPQGRGAEGSTLWRQLRFGSVLDVFVLDGRGERSGTDYLSRAQMDWVKAGLAGSSARFKVILNSVPITDLSAIFGQGAQDDRWEGFPEQRAELLGFIVEAGIEGVLWVSGDVHYAQVGRVDPPGGAGADQFEVFAGPGGSFANVGAELFQGDPQYAWMSSVWNYARFTCDPGTGRVLVEHIDDDGSMLNSVTLQL